MTSCFNSHFSCSPKWSNVFKTNTAGQQNFSERLFLEAVFTNDTNALAGKGLTTKFPNPEILQQVRSVLPLVKPRKTHL